MRKILIINVFISLIFTLPTYAEFECVSVISYSWEKNEDPQLKGTPVPTPTGGQAVNVEWGRAAARGKDEAQGKERLLAVVQDQRNRAMQACKKDHESQADCLATKYASMSSVLNSVRFEARKSLEQAIASDCSAQLGKCLSSSASEAKCTDLAAADAAGTPAAAAGDTKAEAKGKKK